VQTEQGAVRGDAGSQSFAFRGLPYAAPAIGQLRWRPPQPASAWRGVRDATQYAPSCLQQGGLITPPGAQSKTARTSP
jgi:para-nitrobenzyl esterase